MTALIVIPCGAAKIWKRHPQVTMVPARNAYVGSPFVVNRRYAEASGVPWVILSAKYGFISPDVIIEDYNVTFSKPHQPTINRATLRAQAIALAANGVDEVVVLGGKHYQQAAREAFSSIAVVRCPFAGLGLGKAMAAVKQATRRNA